MTQLSKKVAVIVHVIKSLVFLKNDLAPNNIFLKITTIFVVDKKTQIYVIYVYTCTCMYYMYQILSYQSGFENSTKFL